MSFIVIFHLLHILQFIALSCQYSLLFDIVSAQVVMVQNHTSHGFYLCFYIFLHVVEACGCPFSACKSYIYVAFWSNLTLQRVYDAIAERRYKAEKEGNMRQHLSGFSPPLPPSPFLYYCSYHTSSIIFSFLRSIENFLPLHPFTLSKIFVSLCLRILLLYVESNSLT